MQVYHNKLDYYNQGGMEAKDYGFDAQQSLTTSENNKLVFGTSYRKSKATNYISYADGGDISNFALFISDCWEFSPTWSLNAEARYDKHSKAGGKTTFSAGLNKKFDENSHAYFNWGQVFKAPTLDDLYYNVPGMTGNPDLNPEKGDTWTVGYGTRIADKTDVNISYFKVIWKMPLIGLTSLVHGIRKT